MKKNRRFSTKKCHFNLIEVITEEHIKCYHRLDLFDMGGAYLTESGGCSEEGDEGHAIIICDQNYDCKEVHCLLSNGDIINKEQAVFFVNEGDHQIEVHRKKDVCIIKDYRIKALNDLYDGRYSIQLNLVKAIRCSSDYKGNKLIELAIKKTYMVNCKKAIYFKRNRNTPVLDRFIYRNLVK